MPSIFSRSLASQSTCSPFSAIAGNKCSVRKSQRIERKRKSLIHPKNGQIVSILALIINGIYSIGKRPTLFAKVVMEVARENVCTERSPGIQINISCTNAGNKVKVLLELHCSPPTVYCMLYSRMDLKFDASRFLKIYKLIVVYICN
jgi:hypothetical protein